jgi:hypothetical protein
MPLAALTAALLLPGCNDEKTPSTTAPAKESAGPTSTTIAATATATAATATAATAPTSTAAASTGPAKTYDCGAKGQKPCPMQGWMKTVMVAASSSGDRDELSKAFSYASRRSPPGYDEWSTFGEAGAAKAKAGDIDGAKASCKQCHDLYKERYTHEMRDRPF